MAPVTNKRKIINDPVYGFITIPSDLIFDLVEHPYFQRLRRIKQLGLTHLVYPGALHTRFHHSLGALHLMGRSVQTLRSKGHKITSEEENAVYVAILLHDIGHGPFSHALEHTILSNISHEKVSEILIKRLNDQFNGHLEMGIAIFTKKYNKPFLSQLVAGQLDMDRMDFLSRDSFFTGVSEGVIGTQRIINMLNVSENRLVVDEKGIHSVEKFLVARQIMYWQVYLHKTSLAAELMIVKILERAKELVISGQKLFTTPALYFFLSNTITQDKLKNSSAAVDHFNNLDDFDVITAIKVWMNDPDPILSFLCRSLINRKLFRCEISEKAFDYFTIEKIREQIKEQMGISRDDCKYFLISDRTSNSTYDLNSEKILILSRSGKLTEISETSNLLQTSNLQSSAERFFLCYPKGINI